MHLPTVDILIAAKNEARYLGACLSALQSQDYPADRLRIYVIDNGSSDGTPDVAEQYRVPVLRESKRGAAAARNRGLQNSDGTLVGLLDAHCIPAGDWVRLMVEGFVDPMLGGCQSSIDNRSTNARVQWYLEHTGVLSNEHTLADTVSGKRNIYPWILSGASMYRREALVEVGCFDETLTACEDVDLAWRVLLRGYQLGYVPAARLVHYDENTWHGFLKKGKTYGGAAATLAHRYRLHGAKNKFRPHFFWSASPERVLSGLYYWIGYRTQDTRLRLRLARRPEPHIPGPVLTRFRPQFDWAPNTRLRISPSAIFWSRDEDQASVIVHIPTKTRIVLDSAGDFIWRLLVGRQARECVIRAMAEHYNLSSITAGDDLDEFIEDLVHTGIVEREMEAL